MTPKEQPGTHSYDFSPNLKWAFHTYSTFDTPPIVELVELPDHRVVKIVEANEQLHEKAKTVISRPTDFLQLDIGGGVCMDAWMIKPRDFDETK